MFSKIVIALLFVAFDLKNNFYISSFIYSCQEVKLAAMEIFSKA